jgi:hypothetical protein
MSSAISIDASMSRATHASAKTSVVARDHATDALRPWQFFLLLGMLCATAVVIVATGQSVASIVVLSVTILAASLVAIAAYRAMAPLVTPETSVAPPVAGGRTRAAIEREKALVLRSIKELEFDFAMQKIAKSDFDEMSGRLRTRAIGLMRQLDAGTGYQTAIEQELATRLTAPSAAAAPGVVAAADAESMTVEPIVIGTCPCGVSNDADARFCKNCGARLVEEA